MFDYETKIHHWINRLSFLLRAEAQSLLKDAGHDLSAEEWALMMVLWRDGPTQMSKLAATTLRDRTTVTRLVDRLIKKQLVQRAGSETDRRQVMIEVSDHGKSVEKSVLQVMGPLIEKATAGIPKQDIDHAREVLKKMAKNLDS